METQAAEDKTQQNQEGPTSNHVALSSNDEETTQYGPNEVGYQETTSYNDKQIVLYNPQPENQCNPPPQPQPQQGSNPGHLRVLPAIGAYTVQCAMCYKWRFIPTKEKYEEIREHIMEQPFTCYDAQEWTPDLSCDTPGDVEQDESILWAIDKPSIPQTPPGWERDLRIRGEGSANFADVYYVSPLGKKLRSIVEVEKYLLKHPQFTAQGVTLSQFSFKIPRPLQKNYVRKNTPCLTVPRDSNLGTPEPLQAIEGPLSWAAPVDCTTLQLARTNDISPPAIKKARSSTSRTHKSIPLQHNLT